MRLIGLEKDWSRSSSSSPSRSPFFKKNAPRWCRNNDHTVDVNCEISGGNVMCAVTHPQFPNYGQVLLKIHNKKEENRHVLLRTEKGTKEAFFHVEQLRVKDDAEDDDEDFCFDSSELLKDKMDNSKSDVDLHFLNAKKFYLTRLPSKLNDFESSDNGHIIILPPHSKGPVYYAVRMTFALEKPEGETKIKQYPRGLNGDGKIDTTYFRVRGDANKILKKQMCCITARKAKKPSTPCGTYKFMLFDYSGERMSQHFSADDFKKNIYTSEEFVIGKLKFGVPKGFTTIGTNENPLPEKIEKHFRSLEKNTRNIRQVLKLCIKDENFDDNYRALTEKALEAIFFCLCLGDTESIWGDKWPNVFDMVRTEQYKDVRFRLKVHSQRDRVHSFTIYRHWQKKFELEEILRFTDNFRNLKTKVNGQPKSTYKSGYELKNDKKTLAFVNTGTDNEEVNVLNFFMFDVKKLRIKMREDAERKRQLETPLVHDVVQTRGSLRRFTATYRKRQNTVPSSKIPRNNSLQNLYPYADVEYRISDNSNQTKKAVFPSSPDTTATVRRLSPSHLSRTSSPNKRRRLFNQEQPTSFEDSFEDSFKSYDFGDDLSKETRDELFKFDFDLEDLRDDLMMIQDNPYFNNPYFNDTSVDPKDFELPDDISKLFD